MKTSMSVVGVVLGLIAAANVAAAQEFESGARGRTPQGQLDSTWVSSFQLGIGFKALDAADWAPADVQTETALLMDFAPSTWPLRLAVDLRYATEAASISDGFETIDVESTTTEVNLGVRQHWDYSGLRVSAGLGFCLGWAEAEVRGSLGRASEGGFAVGGWFNVGVAYRFEGGFTLGLDVASSRYSPDIAGVTVDAGGVHLGFMVGWSF